MFYMVKYYTIFYISIKFLHINGEINFRIIILLY
jgi:hypothetical protein